MGTILITFPDGKATATDADDALDKMRKWAKDNDVELKPKGCEVTELGYDPQGNKITAITDMAGPQVVAKGPDTHLLSRPMSDHAAAVELGKWVVADGITVYDEWFDLKESDSVGLFAIFGGNLRNLR